MKHIALPYYVVILVATYMLMKPATGNHIPVTVQRADTDLQVIKQRIVADLMIPHVREGEIKKMVQTQLPDGSWPGINYKDVSRTGFEHRIHLENMEDLARAYKKKGSPFFKDAAVKNVFSKALDFWLAHDFICDNWWWNEMGTPNLMINSLLLMDGDLTEKQKTEGLKIAHRANLETFGARPGGDQIVIAGMLGKQALFINSPDTLTKVVKEMASEIHTTTDRGIKPDLSFHHRTDFVISTLSYGTNFINAFAYWAVQTAGTRYALPKESLKLLVDYYLDGICASMVYGKYPDPGAKNRGITRRDALRAAGTDLPENLLKATDYRAKELQDIVKIRKVTMKPALSAEHFFWYSEYFTHQRPGYFASVRMHSSRNHNMEQPHNEEGIKNHHYADGSNFISITGQEYVDIFPAWDWQKIPGTTVVQKEKLPHWNQIAKKGINNFTGAVTDGKYGAAAFDFASVHDPLKARKSWFFFDKEFVCLGAGITATADSPVATTLNQCLLNKTVIVNDGKNNQTLAAGKHALSHINWVLHDKVAYLFPHPTAVQLSNTTQTGTWRSINHQAWATDEPVTKDVFCLWLNHGIKPVNATYEYIVIPDADAAVAGSYHNNPAVVIISNTTTVQAVKHKALNIIQVVFYEAGKVNLGDGLELSVDHPGMVMLTLKGNAIDKITVSDPTHKLITLQLTLNKKFEGSGNNWQALWYGNTNTSIITVELPKETDAGKSLIIAH